MVSSPEALQRMLADLGRFTEIGVDLEAHSYRTYLGLTCLIQVFRRKSF
jgi:exosome complex exonuclease RRP6